MSNADTDTTPRESYVQTWAKANAPGDGMFFKDGFWDQIMFFRDSLARVFAEGETDEERYRAMLTTTRVVGSHRSKSVILPVYNVHLPRYGVDVWLRYNFHDWKVSVESVKPITCDFCGVVPERQDGLVDCYFEGMQDKCFPAYDATSNRSRFSFALGSKFEVYTFFALLMHHLRNRKPGE